MEPETIQTELSTREIYPRLLQYSARYWRWLLLAVLGMAGYAAADTALIYILKPLLDGSIVDRDPFLIRWIPVFLLLLFLGRGVAGFLSNYGMAWVANKVVFAVRSDIFAQYLRLPVSFFDAHSTGKITAKLTFYSSQIAGASTNAITIVVQDTLRVVGFIGLMFYLSWELALVSLTIGPLIMGIIAYVSKRFRRYSGRIQSSMGDLTHISEEVLTGNRVVKVFGGEQFERENFERVNEHNRNMSMRMQATTAASVPVIQFIAAFAVAGVVWIAINDTGGGVMSPGDLAAFFGAMMALMGPIKRLTNVNATIQQGMAAAGAIFELLDEPGEAPGGNLQIERVAGTIEVQSLSFAYPRVGKRVLKGIDFKVEPGKTIAFVGRSGSGKSTLLSLLPRFYEPTAGAILLDGHDIREFSLASLREQISLVDQNVVLFNDTVARNIAYGLLRNADRAAIEDAAKRAHAAEFIESLPQGYDTVVGQNGIMLSGGQRQRLAIARALLKDAPILILDEATSALDTESERAIQQGLDQLMRDRTTLVIAHRLSTIQYADQIVVLQDGQIVEQGTHAQLLARNGQYRDLYTLQFASAG